MKAFERVSVVVYIERMLRLLFVLIRESICYNIIRQQCRNSKLVSTPCFVVIGVEVIFAFNTWQCI